MGKHLENRPPKKVFKKEIIDSLRDKAIEKLKSELLPHSQIIKIILIGSSIKETFGEYEPPGFRESLFSDFDFIVFVEDDYQIPDWLDKELTAKPFPDDKINLAYRKKEFIDNKYDIEVFFMRKTNMEDPKIQELGEQAGIPMKSNSSIKHLIVYTKN